MWWETVEDQRSDPLRANVAELTERFRQHVADSAERPDQQLIWGVGSAPDADGRWANELVLVAREALGAESELDVGRYRATDVIERLVRSPVWLLLRDFPIETTTLIDVTTRPLAAAAVGIPDLVREAAAPNRTATAGLPCMLNSTNTPAFITAGHLVSAVGDLVDIFATGHGSPTWVRGRVVHWEDPATTSAAGYDYAVVELLAEHDQILSVTHAGVAGPPHAPYAPIGAAAYGAVSGSRTGQISGALTQLGDATRQWSSCWQIGPSYLLTLGDSGSVVLGTTGKHTGKVLGHFVGGSYWAQGPGLIHQYVQDLDACLQAGLNRHITI